MEQPVPSPGAPPTERTLMLVFCYLHLLSLIPMLTKKADREIRWHARNGLTLTVAITAAWILLAALSLTPTLGCLFLALMLAATAVYGILAVVCIVYALNGQRLIIPGITTAAQRWGQ